MEHPILFLDLLFEKFGLHIPPHLSYAVLAGLILLGLGWLAGREVNLVPKGAQNVFETGRRRPGRVHGGRHR